MLQVFETAVRYQMYHALALGLTAFSIKSAEDKLPVIAGWLFITGTVLFSGSLYLLSISGIKWIGAFTPFGGIAFLAGWLLMTIHFIKRNNILKP